MEELRQKMAQSGLYNVYPVRSGPSGLQSQSLNTAIQSNSPSRTVITISSTQSSPKSPGWSDSPGHNSDTVDTPSRNQDHQKDTIRDNGEHKKGGHRRIILDSDEEIDSNTTRSQTSHEKGPISNKLKPHVHQSNQPSATSVHLGQQPGIINPLWETFDETENNDLYDPMTSAEDAERDLQDLLSQSMNDASEEVDMSLAVVKGFKDDIKLLPHQVIGRKWMKERETGKKNGGILADDMGLGKTIQTLTRIIDGRPGKADKDSGFDPSTLVVCPVGLVSQWAAEIQNMAIGLRVIEHHGPGRTTDPEVLKRSHVVITSYSVLSSEYASFQKQEVNLALIKHKAKYNRKGNSSYGDNSSGDGSDDEDDEDFGKFGRTTKKKAPVRPKKVMDAIFRIKWWRIVLDEAHNIKNRKTKAAQACCALEGKYRWCLTGTPLQNSVEELYSLIKFLRIRPLNDWEVFNNRINKPVKSGRSVAAMKRLHVVLKAIMLRRQKDGLFNGKPLISLPSRILEIVHCVFDAYERNFYEKLESKAELTLQKFANSGNVMRNYTSVLVLLLRLRQACNHPSLISKDIISDMDAVDPIPARAADDADDLADMFDQMGLSSIQRCEMCQSVLSSTETLGNTSKYCRECQSLANEAKYKSFNSHSANCPPDSAKIRKIMELLRSIEERSNGEEKTIIFSQFTSMLDLIQPFLRSSDMNFVRYDGSMRKEQREESLEKIRTNKSTKCILISFKAGSTGLNLTACNNVILVDLWWNPALEDQAFDRAHRLGQTRQVNIYKLTIERTVEERILALQMKKRELATATLSGDKLKNSRLGLDDLMTLFKRDDVDG